MNVGRLLLFVSNYFPRVQKGHPKEAAKVFFVRRFSPFSRGVLRCLGLSYTLRQVRQRAASIFELLVQRRGGRTAGTPSRGRTGRTSAARVIESSATRDPGVARSIDPVPHGRPARGDRARVTDTAIKGRSSVSSVEDPPVTTLEVLCAMGACASAPKTRGDGAWVDDVHDTSGHDSSHSGRGGARWFAAEPVDAVTTFTGRGERFARSRRDVDAERLRERVATKTSARKARPFKYASTGGDHVLRSLDIDADAAPHHHARTGSDGASSSARRDPATRAGTSPGARPTTTARRPPSP